MSLADFSVAADLILEPFVQLPLGPYAEIRRWGATMTELPAWQTVIALQRDFVAFHDGFVDALGVTVPRGYLVTLGTRR